MLQAPEQELQTIEREVQEIQQLALTPTPANFQNIQLKLQNLAACLSQALADPEVVTFHAAQFRRLCQQLPAEMSRLRSLMEAPVSFYQQMESLRALHFGSYERTGAIRCLASKPSARTVMHL